jgi:two-component system, NarL family, sensor histidine kinase DesK
VGDRGGRAALAPRLTWAIPVFFLCLLLPAGVGIAAYWAGPAAGVLAAAAFALPLLYAVPRGRALWARHRGWLLAAQALLTYLPFAAFGGTGSPASPGCWAGCCC